MIGARRALLAARASTPAFDPATLSPHLWLDPSDLATLFQQSNGTGAVMADSDPVGYCGGKGGSVGNAVQSTAGARPLYKTSGGLHFLRFDGVDDQLVGPSIADILTSATYDIVCAAIAQSITTDTGAMVQNDGVWADSDGYMGLHFRGTDSVGLNATNYDGNYDTASTPYTAGTAALIHMRHDGAGNLSITKNSDATVTVASSTAAGGFGGQTLRLGWGSIAYTELDLYGFFARKTLLTAGELASLKTWMGAKVGIVL